MSYKQNAGYNHNGGYKHLEFDRDSIFLVTGGAGFIGSNLCEALLDMGYQVRCMDNFSTGKRENIEGFLHNKNFTLIEVKFNLGCFPDTNGEYGLLVIQLAF